MGINTVAVIGAGTMGAGIAQVCAQAGWKTNLFDAFPEGLERGMNAIDAFWDKGIARGKTTPEQKVEWAANLHAVSNMAEAVGDAALMGLGKARRGDDPASPAFSSARSSSVISGARSPVSLRIAPATMKWPRNSDQLIRLSELWSID